jgi:hypothetical protein
MSVKSRRALWFALGCVTLFGPFIVMTRNLGLGLLLAMVGYVATAAIIQILRNGQATGARVAGRTILVQLVDDTGHDLPASEVELRMAEARLRAAPADKVLGVLYKVSENRR